jgi:hypothetical protein
LRIADGQPTLPDPDPTAVFVAHAELHVEFRDLASEHRSERLVEARRVFGMDPAEPPLPGRLAFFRANPQHLVGPRGTIGIACFQIGLVRRAMECGHRQAVAFLGLGKGLSDPVLIGDVQHRSDAALGPARIVKMNLPYHQDPALGAVIKAADAEFGLIAPPTSAEISGTVTFVDPIPVRDMDEGREQVRVGLDRSRQAADGEEFAGPAALARDGIDVPGSDSGRLDRQAQPLLVLADHLLRIRRIHPFGVQS